jgi:SAM-dependent methyltransferase
MRRRALDALLARVPAGSTLLDLGCGPGTDAEEVARLGHRVVAIDWSPAMVAETTRRIERAGLADAVKVRHLGIQHVDRLAPASFDAAWSNFGPLNCVPSLPAAARLIAQRLRPGGVLIASVIGRVCPWEIALFLARGDWPRAKVRFERGLVPVPLDGKTVWMRYYAPRAFAKTFDGAGFECVSLRALGLFVPPPYAAPFAERHPSFVAALQRLDDALGTWPGLRSLGDHFLIVLRKR